MSRLAFIPSCRLLRHLKKQRPSSETIRIQSQRNSISEPLTPAAPHKPGSRSTYEQVAGIRWLLERNGGDSLRVSSILGVSKHSVQLRLYIDDLHWGKALRVLAQDRESLGVLRAIAGSSCDIGPSA